MNTNKQTESLENLVIEYAHLTFDSAELRSQSATLDAGSCDILNELQSDTLLSTAMTLRLQRKSLAQSIADKLLGRSAAVDIYSVADTVLDRFLDGRCLVTGRYTDEDEAVIAYE